MKKLAHALMQCTHVLVVCNFSKKKKRKKKKKKRHYESTLPKRSSLKISLRHGMYIS